MQQKHVITHPDPAWYRQNQNYPQKYCRVIILFSYEQQLNKPISMCLLLQISSRNSLNIFNSILICNITVN